MFTLETARELTGRQIRFNYNGKERTLMIQEGKQCANGSQLVVGVDVAIFNQANSIEEEKASVRSFHIGNMQNVTVLNG
jgi:hypothetical protein